MKGNGRSGRTYGVWVPLVDPEVYPGSSGVTAQAPTIRIPPMNHGNRLARICAATCAGDVPRQTPAAAAPSVNGNRSCGGGATVIVGIAHAGPYTRRACEAHGGGG